MTDDLLVKIAYSALKKACKWMRENPPGDLGGYNDDLLKCLVGGASDPEGKKFVNYFLNQAMDEQLSADAKDRI